LKAWHILSLTFYVAFEKKNNIAWALEGMFKMADSRKALQKTGIFKKIYL